jgi:magnesium-protoporphyrin IX monomethyl ester (oxidative) cyclase
MRANPWMLDGANRLWIRFFLLAVFATMYVRDHARPVFHAALGLDPTAYDFQVFHITSEIAKQTFPVSLDLDNPAFRAGLERLSGIAKKIAALNGKPKLTRAVLKLTLQAQAAAVFVKLFLMKPKNHALPNDVRLAPSW